MYSWILLEFEPYLVLNGPQHFERSASRIIEVRSIASQADHRVIELTDWEWDGLFTILNARGELAYYS